jgi:rare lipoprotein A
LQGEAPGGIQRSDSEIFQVGYAHQYADIHQGRRTASGEIYDRRNLTAAHRTLPIGARVKVENVSSGASVVVRINDRGPYVEGRIIDVSRAAARELDMDGDGYTLVRLVEVDPAADIDTRAVTAIDVSRRSQRQVSGDSEGNRDANQNQEYYTVQLGSYAERGSADELAARYDEAWVQEIEVNTKTVFRVNFGVYSDKTSAERARLDLTQADGFVKQVDGDPPIEIISNR